MNAKQFKQQEETDRLSQQGSSNAQHVPTNLASDADRLPRQQACIRGSVQQRDKVPGQHNVGRVRAPTMPPKKTSTARPASGTTNTLFLASRQHIQIPQNAKNEEQQQPQANHKPKQSKRGTKPNRTRQTIDFARLVEKELEKDPRFPETLKNTIISRARKMVVKKLE